MVNFEPESDWNLGNSKDNNQCYTYVTQKTEELNYENPNITLWEALFGENV